MTSQAGESRQSRSVSQSAPRDSTARNIEPNSFNPRPGDSSSESRSSGSSIQCHHCHNRGHIAARCPQRAKALAHESSDPPESEDQIVDPLQYSGDEDETGDAFEVDDHHVNVVRCILSTAVDNDEWKRINIFHTFIRCGERTCKLVIEGGSTMNVVSKSAIARLNLKVEPHPQPFSLG